MEFLSTRLPKQQKYSKSDLFGLSRCCDWFIFGNQIIYNVPTDTPKSIFISSYQIVTNVRFFVNRILPNIVIPVKLIIGSEDVSFPKGIHDVRYEQSVRSIQKSIDIMMQSKMIKHIYVENLDLIHPKLTPIPLGFHPVYNPNLIKLYTTLLYLTKININRSINVFCNHRMRVGSSQWDERSRVKSLCEKEWKNLVVWKDNLTDANFRATLLDAKMCICVRGGGIDPSPRAWMALLCGCFPIIHTSTINKAYERFPVIFIKEWNSQTITSEKIVNWTKRFETFYENDDNRKSVIHMLTLEYWKKYILGN